MDLETLKRLIEAINIKPDMGSRPVLGGVAPAPVGPAGRIADLVKGGPGPLTPMVQEVFKRTLTTPGGAANTFAQTPRLIADVTAKLGQGAQKVGGGMSALKKAILGGLMGGGAIAGGAAMMGGDEDPRHLTMGPRQDIVLKPEKPIRKAIKNKSAAAKVAPATEAMAGDYFGPLKYSFGDFPSEELTNPTPPVLNSINLTPGATPEASPEFTGNLTPEQKKNLLLRALTLGLKG